MGVELRKHLIVAQKVRRSPANGSKDFIPVVKKASKARPIKPVLGDKGYDSEENHRVGWGRAGSRENNNPSPKPGSSRLAYQNEI